MDIRVGDRVAVRWDESDMRYNATVEAIHDMPWSLDVLYDEKVHGKPCMEKHIAMERVDENIGGRGRVTCPKCKMTCYQLVEHCRSNVRCRPDHYEVEEVEEERNSRNDDDDDHDHDHEEEAAAEEVEEEDEDEVEEVEAEEMDVSESIDDNILADGAMTNVEDGNDELESESPNVPSTSIVGYQLDGNVNPEDKRASSSSSSSSRSGKIHNGLPRPVEWYNPTTNETIEIFHSVKAAHDKTGIGMKLSREAMNAGGQMCRKWDWVNEEGQKQVKDFWFREPITGGQSASSSSAAASVAPPLSTGTSASALISSSQLQHSLDDDDDETTVTDDNENDDDNDDDDGGGANDDDDDDNDDDDNGGGGGGGDG